MKNRTGGVQEKRGRLYARVRLGKGKRLLIPLDGCGGDPKLAVRRSHVIAHVANVLIKAKRQHSVEDLARAIGAATFLRDIENHVRAAEKMAAMGAPANAGETFEKFAQRWTSGALSKSYPDKVPAKKDTRTDGVWLKHVLPTIGPIPLSQITLDIADDLMGNLPSTLSLASRRHVAQVVHRVLNLAVYPAKIVSSSPLPRGWLPKLGSDKAKSYLYPTEEADLVSCPSVDRVYRLFYGFLSREGMRTTEARTLSWMDIDLERGVVVLDENKTDDPRAWALSKDVVRALVIWKRMHPKSDGPFAKIAKAHLAEYLRDDLRKAEVKRAQLFQKTTARIQIRAHDLRGTFVTISLANGRSETWVQDRTGHKTTGMVAKYRRAARTAAELGLGELGPLDVLVFGQGGPRMGSTNENATESGDVMRAGKQVVASTGVEPVRPKGTADFKTTRGVAGGREIDTNGRVERKAKRAKRLGAQTGPTLEVIETVSEGAVDVDVVRSGAVARAMWGEYDELDRMWLEEE